MKVDVYRNLHTGNLSVREKGLVVDHVHDIWISKAHFVVNPAGRARVLRQRRKNVHAFVRGYQLSEMADRALIAHGKDGSVGATLRYNPYESDGFVEIQTGRKVRWAELAYVGPEGVVAYGPMEYHEETSETSV